MHAGQESLQAVVGESPGGEPLLEVLANLIETGSAIDGLQDRIFLVAEVKETPRNWILDTPRLRTLPKCRAHGELVQLVIYIMMSIIEPRT